MKTIKLKTDDAFDALLKRLSERLGISRSAVVRKAVDHLERTVVSEEWAERIREASLKTRDESLRTCRYFNAANADGL